MFVTVQNQDLNFQRQMLLSLLCSVSWGDCLFCVQWVEVIVCFVFSELRWLFVLCSVSWSDCLFCVQWVEVIACFVLSELRWLFVLLILVEFLTHHSLNFLSIISEGPSWSYGSCIYNYLCNQYLSALKLWVRTTFMAGCTRYNIYEKVCQWLSTGWWFSPGTTVFSTNKTDCHDITEILLKVALNTIIQTKP